jgi:hypothetical protein
VGSKDKPNAGKSKARLQLKGRIYMANVTDIVWLQKPGKKDFANFTSLADVPCSFAQAPTVSRSSGKGTLGW